MKADQFQSGNVFSLAEVPSASDGSSEALDLVYKAADMFRDLEERARDTEARAHAMCRAASATGSHSTCRPRSPRPSSHVTSRRSPPAT